MRYFFILKPPLRRRFQKYFFKFQKENFLVFFKTQKVGQFNAENLAKKAVREGFERIIVAGGDGLLNETINGAIRECKNSNCPIVFGILPQGSGNNFAKELGIPQGPKEAFSVLKKGKVLEVDLGKVNNRFFVNCFSLGFDAEINYLANKIKERFEFLPKNFAYFFAALEKIIKKIPEFEVELRGEEINLKEKITFLAITNTQSYGGIFKINPGAKFSDGKFNMCIARPTKKLKAIYGLFLAIKGKHSKLPEIRHYIFQKDLKINVKFPVIWEVDGEVFKPEKEFLVKIYPRAIKILVP